MGGPIIHATVKLEQMQISVMHAFSEAIAPLAEDIQRQVEHAVQTMDFEAELARLVDYEVKQAIRKKLTDRIEEIVESDEFLQHSRKLVEAKVQQGLESRIEQEVRYRIEDHVRRNVVELFNGDVKVLVDRQMAKYKGQKDKKPWWRWFGRG